MTSRLLTHERRRTRRRTCAASASADATGLRRALLGAPAFAAAIALAFFFASTTAFASGPAAAVNDARIKAADEEPGQWMAHGRDWAEQRYSPLTGIDSSNVTRLGLAWAWEPGTTRGMEATPLVIDGVMYATGEWSRVYALDAKTGKPLWTYDPFVMGAKGRDGCCDVVNRGVAAYEGRLYLGAFDGRLICLDAATGKVIWEKQTTDPSKPYTITGAPRVLKGKVLIGNGGAEFGVRGYFGAYDAETGDLLWRFYTVPGSADGPFEQPELEMAAKSWSRDSLFESGLGGTVWDSMAYDPDLDLLYVGVGNASVYNRDLRSPGGGDNLFVSSILAVNPDDGRLVWHYQTTPGDQWDYTATQHMILADVSMHATIGSAGDPATSAGDLAESAGDLAASPSHPAEFKPAPVGATDAAAPRKVLMQAPKNGFFYVLDRATGELLSAEPYVDTSWASGIDEETGRPLERPEAWWLDGRAMVTPGIPGGHNWHPMAYSPKSGLVYIPTFESVYAFFPNPSFAWKPGNLNTAEDWNAISAELEGFESFAKQNVRTHLTAWDPGAGRQAWRVELGHGIPAGVLATAGNLVFQGMTWGKLRAYEADSGATLWESDTGTGVMAPPVTYEVDGEQYVAVVAGLGGSQGGHYIRFPNANPGRILAFKLDARSPLPPMPTPPTRRVEAPAVEASADLLAKGRSLYSFHCARCHGIGVQSSGLYPDLRTSSAEVFASWKGIVLGGAFAARGMASFADVIGEDDAEAIRVYVATRAKHEPGWLEWIADSLAGRLQIPAKWLAD